MRHPLQANAYPALAHSRQHFFVMTKISLVMYVSVADAFGCLIWPVTEVAERSFNS